MSSLFKVLDRRPRLRGWALLAALPPYRDLLALGKSWEAKHVRAVYRRAVASVTWKEIREGRLIRPDACDECGGDGRIGKSKGIQGHHPDYDQPLLVEWLCCRCHGRADGRRRSRERTIGRQIAA